MVYLKNTKSVLTVQTNVLVPSLEHFTATDKLLRFNERLVIVLSQSAPKKNLFQRTNVAYKVQEALTHFSFKICILFLNDKFNAK